MIHPNPIRSTIQRWSSRWRSSKRSPRTISEQLDALLDGAEITSDGENFYKEGLTITSWQQQEDFEQHWIIPRFDNLQRLITEMVNGIRQDQLRQQKEATEATNEAGRQLNEETDNTELAAIRKKIDEYRQNEKELEDLGSPEKKMASILKEAFSAAAQKMEETAPGQNTRQDNLERLLDIKEKASLANASYSNYQALQDRFSAVRQSNFFPPKKSYFRIFLVICVLLCVAEIGFSMTIFNHIIETGLGHKFGINLGYFVNIFLSAICSIMGSAALAIIFKQMMETHLYNGNKKTGQFIFISAIILLLLILLFSSHSLGMLQDPIIIIPGLKFTQGGIVVGCYSLLYALANAILFRQAANLDHLHTSIYGHSSSRKLNRSSRMIRSKWEHTLQQSQKRSADLSDKLAAIESSLTNATGRIDNLKQIALTKFRKGCSDAMITLVKTNGDIIIHLIQKMQRKSNPPNEITKQHGHTKPQGDQTVPANGPAAPDTDSMREQGQPFSENGHGQ